MTLVSYYAKLTSMSSDNRTKINRLLAIWPKGTVVTLKWLKKQMISQQLANSYKNSKWLESIGQGAFIRLDDKVDWTGGVYALQKQLNLPIHIGAKTSLQMQGYAHSLPLGKNYAVWLFGTPGTKIPAWFKKHQWNVDVKYVTSNLFAESPNMSLTKKSLGEYEIILSSPERAILEVLYFVPRKESFEKAFHLMEGLTALRSDLLQVLLKQCSSIKVKRLFLFLAEYCSHAWQKKLDMSSIDLGKGKRALVKNGIYNAKYKITIPETFSRQDKL